MFRFWVAACPLKALLIAAIASAILSSSGCETSKQTLEVGTQPHYEGFIPARIAVLDAQLWPIAARYPGQTPVNIDQEDLDGIFESFNQSVLKSFSNQPFMKGFSPKYIRKLLTLKQKEHILKEIPQVWRVENRDCSDCFGPIKAYNSMIAPKSDWRLWLNNLSREVRYSDAVLMPLLIAAYQQQFDDRGLLVSKRSLEIAVLLVDTNNGSLQWVGHRKASMVNDRIRGVEKQFPPYPKWENLYKRAFTLDLWREFPGMQQNR